jgi:hypothetical protein
MPRQILRFNSIEEAEALLRQGYFDQSINKYDRIIPNTNDDYFIPTRIEDIKPLEPYKSEPINQDSKPLGGKILKNEIQMITNTPLTKKKWWQIWK